MQKFGKLLLVLALSVSGSAQNQSTTSDSDLLKELATMRARIDQLESELRRRDAAIPDPPSSGSLQTSPSSLSAEPFAFTDWSWLNGNPRTKETAYDSKFFTPEVRADVGYTYSFNHPSDNTIGGS